MTEFNLRDPPRPQTSELSKILLMKLKGIQEGFYELQIEKEKAFFPLQNKSFVGSDEPFKHMDTKK